MTGPDVRPDYIFITGICWEKKIDKLELKKVEISVENITLE